MALSRRSFLGTAGMGAGAAVLGGHLHGIAFGEPLRAAARDGFLLLNNNENAYGPFASVQAVAAGALKLANRYPDHHYTELLDALAARYKVTPEQVVLGNGSTEVLRVAVAAFTGPQRKLVMASPTFEAPGYYAAATGAEMVRVPLTSAFAHDLDAMLARSNGAGLVYICNPNNPTASITPRSQIEQFLRKLPPQTYVLLDEAYHDFCAAPEYLSFLERPVDNPRLVVARTFSKVYALAGMRVGYGIATAETARLMRRWQLLDNVNIVAAACAVTALGDQAATRAAVERNAADRAQFLKQAAERKLRPIDSWANFVMMETGRPVRALIEHFRAHNILVGRPFPPMETYLRVSLGRPEEMAAFWQVWDKLPPLATH